MVMEGQTSPRPPFSTAGLGLCEPSFSHSSFGDRGDLWVFWSTCGNDEGRCTQPHHPPLTVDGDGAVIKNNIIRFLQLLTKAMPWRCLVQFWGLVKKGDKMYLTTCDQPFALRYYCSAPGNTVKELCEYREHCLKYLIRTMDDDNDDDEISDDGVQLKLIGGPPARVFRSGLPEYAYDVSDYTSTEYPLRDYAVNRVKGYWALPVYHHPTQHLPSGVLECAVSMLYDFSIHQKEILAKLQEVNLRATCLSLPQVSLCQDGEIAKIDEALDKVEEILEMDGGTHIWTTTGEILRLCRGYDFLRKGQRVVGKAFSSKSACFCRDIRQLSITKYPLVPKARHFEYSPCFAVCLQSSCSNNCIYVLEFFLPKTKKDHGDPRTLLRMLMETLKEHLQSSFKLASGQELGQKLSVEVIKVSRKDEFDSFEICNTTGTESTPRLGEAQGGEGMMQLHSSSQQVDAANGSINCNHEQRNGSVGSTPRLAKAQGGEGMTQVDFSSLQVDTANAYVNSVHGQQSGIVGSPPRPEHVQGFVNISDQELMTVQFNSPNVAGVDVAHNSVNGIHEQQNGTVGSSPRQELVQNIENIAHDEPTMEIDVENPERYGASIE